MPQPAEMIASFKRRGVRTILNLHPAYGVQYFDSSYAALAAALGADPRTQMPLVGDYTNASWAVPFLNITLQPLEALGVDAWWPDWQQNEWSPVMGASPQLMQSYVYSSNRFRYGPAAAADRAGLASSDRPFVLSRWGGYGHHRCAPTPGTSARIPTSKHLTPAALAHARALPQPQVPDRFLRRCRDKLGHAALPGVLDGHGGKRRLVLVT
jgi:alpha-glucosidase (family GH31 glycosyl hydrolase)